MNRTAYHATRRQYRTCLEQDRADARKVAYHEALSDRALNYRRPVCDSAQRLLATLPARIAESLRSRPLRKPIVRQGPRARAFAANRPRSGQFARLDLAQRVALRRALAAVAAARPVIEARVAAARSNS